MSSELYVSQMSQINTVYTEQYFNNMSETQMQNFNFDKGVSY